MFRNGFRVGAGVCVAAAAAALIVLVGSVPAGAATLACGAVVSSSTTLDNDLVGCSGDAVTIIADNVTFDLKGHTISGGADAIAGVRVPPGHSGITIENGTVQGFSAGIVLDSSTNLHVVSITAQENVRGIEVDGTTSSLVEKNTLLDNQLDGIRLGLSSGNTIRRNLATGNVWGLSVADGSSNNLITQNVSVGNRFGLPLFTNADGNTVLRNEVSENVYYGIAVQHDSIDNSLEQNTVLGNGTDGIHVESDGNTGTVLFQNTASENGGDGIHVDVAPATITKNTATYNGSYGIEAVPGVTDGGGNVAFGNGAAAQCLNVSCSAA